MKKVKGYIWTALIALSIVSAQIALICKDIKTHYTITGLSLLPLLCVLLAGLAYSVVKQLFEIVKDEGEK